MQLISIINNTNLIFFFKNLLTTPNIFVSTVEHHTKKAHVFWIKDIYITGASKE